MVVDAEPSAVRSADGAKGFGTCEESTTRAARRSRLEMRISKVGLDVTILPPHKEVFHIRSRRLRLSAPERMMET
ncbi:hypothetical protein BH708_09895 [Brachybacterium sp. P6-10-X1]|nr:hypothetical protein BH708_09895 [Brachybacterium sp. P6-10-X1]